MAEHPSRAVALFHNPVTAWAILVCGIGLTGAAWWLSSSSLQQRAEERFAFRTREIRHAIDDRMRVYEQVLWGGVGLFNAAGTPTREQWRAYVATLEIDEHWPGIQGIGFAVPLAPSEVQSHVAKIRAEGFPDYTISPPGERDAYSAIVYLEPFDWRNRRAFGYDMWSHDVRRAAMTRARDTGESATSGVITLVQETEQDVQKGFLTYVPVYAKGAPVESVEDRRSAFVGWVYSAFRMGDLMAGILGSGEGEIEYEIFDGRTISEDRLLFDSDDRFDGTEPLDRASPGEGRWFENRVALRHGGRDWTVVFAADPEIILGSQAHDPTAIAIGGIVVDLLLFYVISSLALLQRRSAKVASRTQGLLNAQRELEERAAELERHAEGLERTNSELQQFAFVASHDLQEPLRAIASFSGLLREHYAGQFDDTGNGWLTHVVQNAERMSNLIRDLLDYSKLDNLVQAFTRVELDAALDEALANLSAAIVETGARVERHPLPSVDGDRSQLTQLFQNLVGNAIKYRADGRSPVVRICAEETPTHWRVQVEDNGIGIKPAFHARIFEIFRRVGPRSKYPGTGIGLAICRRVVDRHGGEIGVESELGVGSTFWFALRRTVERKD